jgi:hypothetical protein
MADAVNGNQRSTNDGSAGERSSPEDDAARVGERFEQWGRRVGRFLAGAAARAREEAEDIVAEAQSIRRGERE